MGRRLGIFIIYEKHGKIHGGPWGREIRFSKNAPRRRKSREPSVVEEGGNPANRPEKLGGKMRRGRGRGNAVLQGIQKARRGTETAGNGNSREGGISEAERGCLITDGSWPRRP